MDPSVAVQTAIVVVEMIGMDAVSQVSHQAHQIPAVGVGVPDVYEDGVILRLAEPRKGFLVQKYIASGKHADVLCQNGDTIRLCQFLVEAVALTCALQKLLLFLRTLPVHPAVVVVKDDMTRMKHSRIIQGAAEIVGRAPVLGTALFCRIFRLIVRLVESDGNLAQLRDQCLESAFERMVMKKGKDLHTEPDGRTF